MPERSGVDGEPTYEALKEENAGLRLLVAEQAARIAEQVARIAELEGRIADLEGRLGRNPRNSSMPPSAEGLAKPPRRTGPRGGQPSASRASSPARRESTSHRSPIPTT